MSYPDPDHNQHQRSQTHQSIPLQDLNRPPDENHNAPAPQSQSHRRTLSDRGRNLLRQTGGITTGQFRSAQYAPIADVSPSPTRRPRLNTDTAVGQSSGMRRVVHDGDVADSPIDAGAFQAAIGFGMDMNFQGDTSPPLSPILLTPGASEQPHYPYTPDPYAQRGPSEDHGYFASVDMDDDTARLTDARHLQPISGAAGGLSPGAIDRSSFQSVQFLSPGGTSPGGRYSADVGLAESASGLSPSRSRTRSLSPGNLASPLHRAGTIMRNISQRVVNVTNDSEVAERHIQRKSTLRQSQTQHDPGLTALPEYMTDGPSTPGPTTPIEKPPTPIVRSRRSSVQWQKPMNPFRGNSLGIFPADSTLRLKLSDILVNPNTEPILLVLIVVQTVLLAVDARTKAQYEPGHVKELAKFSIIDWVLLGLFVVYTIEAVIRIIVSGFIINPVEYSTINRQVGLRDAVLAKANHLFAGVQRQPSQRKGGTNTDSTFGGPQQPSVLRTFTTAQMLSDPGPTSSRERQRLRLAHRAYLRHSFNRTDFVAVVSFWISLLLGALHIKNTRVILVFQMLSCLRIIRLLNLTSGTSVILRSLKKAAPLLLNVAFLIGFFWLLFAIIGVQSFKSSFRRNCVWTDPDDPTQNYTNSDQFCGGQWINDNGKLVSVGYQAAPGRPAGPEKGKGFLCPVNSICVEADNPHNGTQSFDNVLQSLELVFVIMSSNTWSDLMYTVSDTDYLVSTLFFIIGILILSLWLVSLLIAVITSTFQIIREESKTSAFTGEIIVEEDSEKEQANQRVSSLKRIYDKTSGVWVLIIAFGLVAQMMRSAGMSNFRRNFIDVTETIITLALLGEILVRFIVDWRHFFKSRRNLTDLMIAIITTVIQLPAVKAAHGGRAYAWLSIFQIMRVYRIVLAVPVTRDLIVSSSSFSSKAHR